MDESECNTVCSCADVRIPLENTNLAPCVLIHIEQVKSCAADIVYPYQKGQDSEVKLGIPTSVQSEPLVFAPNPT